MLSPKGFSALVVAQDALHEVEVGLTRDLPSNAEAMEIVQSLRELEGRLLELRLGNKNTTHLPRAYAAAA